jgi:hypothetical protein
VIITSIVPDDALKLARSILGPGTYLGLAEATMAHRKRVDRKTQFGSEALPSLLVSRR